MTIIFTLVTLLALAFLIALLVLLFALASKGSAIAAQKYPEQSRFAHVLIKASPRLLIIACIFYGIYQMLITISTEQNGIRIPTERLLVTLDIVMALSLVFLRWPHRWTVFFVLMFFFGAFNSGLDIMPAYIQVAAEKGDINEARSISIRG